MMLITEHPFHVLGISSRSNKREILARAEELSLRSSSEQTAMCRLQVTHPTKRLDAEVSWFPGVPPSKIRQILETIIEDSNLPLKFEEKLSGVDCLGRFNALAYWLGTHDDVSPPVWGLALHHLTNCAEAVETEEIADALNSDRSAAGFPAITEFSGVVSAVARHEEAAAAFLAERLIHCPRHGQVLSLIVDRETESGESQSSEFMNRFVDRYQIHVQPFLDRRGDDIAARCEELLSIAQSNADNGQIHIVIQDIEDKLSEWDTVAQPIQLIMKSRGLKDKHSIAVAKRVRNAAIHLANKCDLHEEARRLTARLCAVFEEVPDAAEVAEQDSETLDEIISAKSARRKRDEDFRTEIEVDIMIGKDRLQINHEFIAYKKRRLGLEEVSRLRWGIFKSYTNGVRTSREFTIWVGPSDHGRGIVIECVRFMESEETVLQRYATILEKLWKAVGFRILLELASKIMEGEDVPFGEAAVSKTGIWLTKKKWFSSERYFAQWEELSKSSEGGALWMGSTKEPKASVSLVLRDVDNAVILERLLAILWRDGNHNKFQSGTLFSDDSNEV